MLTVLLFLQLAPSQEPYYVTYKVPAAELVAVMSAYACDSAGDRDTSARFYREQVKDARRTGIVHRTALINAGGISQTASLEVKATKKRMAQLKIKLQPCNSGEVRRIRLCVNTEEPNSRLCDSPEMVRNLELYGEVNVEMGAYAEWMAEGTDPFKVDAKP